MDDEENGFISEQVNRPSQASHLRLRIRSIIVLSVLFFLAIYFLFISQNSSENGNEEGEGDEEGEEDVTFYEIQAKCIPNVCYQEKDFLHHVKDHSLFTSLSTFPGSGNTWTRSFLEEGTRVWTGSIYKLEFDSKPSIKRDPDAQTYPTLIVTKNHFPSMESDTNPLGGVHHEHLQDYSNFIIILRDPFDAIIADFNRIDGQHQDGEFRSPHQNVISNNMFRTYEFREFVHHRFNGFKRFVMFWLPPKFWEMDENNSLPPGIKLRKVGRAYEFTYENFKGMEPDKVWAKQYHTKPKTISVLVAFYEDLAHDFLDTAGPIFEYLSNIFGTAIPNKDDATLCALVNEAKTELFHRHKKSKIFNPFTTIPDLNKTIPAFCDKIKSHWVTPKWGPCEEAILQKTRNVPTRKISNLPTERCENK